MDNGQHGRNRRNRLNGQRKRVRCPLRLLEVIAEVAFEGEFDDFDVGSVSRKSTYPVRHRRFARNPNPTPKARIRPKMDFCNYLIRSIASMLSIVHSPSLASSDLTFFLRKKFLMGQNTSSKNCQETNMTLIPKHGGYRSLLSFQIAQLV